MTRVLYRDEWLAWAAAGKPPMGPKQFRRAMRSVYRCLGKSDEAADAHVMMLDAGVDPEAAAIMADADPELKAMHLASMTSADSRALTLDGPDPEEAKIMLGADPELRALWLSQMAADPDPKPSTAPLAMDDDRYKLHLEAKALSAKRLSAEPRLDPGETYALSAIEIADRGTSVI